jgi:adenine phosphoribosyltransferase
MTAESQDTGELYSCDEYGLKAYCRDVNDFPKAGVIFRDITNLLKDKGAFNRMVDSLSHRFHDQSIDIVASIEARGFIVGSAVAYRLGAGFVPVRKEGKLPWRTHKKTYALEYGEGVLEVHQDAISQGQRVLIVDDVLATGGTAKAVVELVHHLGGELVCVAVLIELPELGGRRLLQETPVYSLLRF